MLGFIWRTIILKLLSLVLNNILPIGCPTGFFFRNKEMLSRYLDPTSYIAHKTLPVSLYSYYNIISTAVAAAFCGPCAIGAAASNAFYSTLAQTGSFSQAFFSGGVAAFSATATWGVGKIPGVGAAKFALNREALGQVFTKVVLHGVIGGVTAQAQGGNFGSGFAAAGFGAAASASGLVGPLKEGPKVQGVVVSAIAGGTASAITGGKFANGAKTGAFGYILNASMEEAAAQKGINELASDTMAGKYDSPQAAAAALHDNDALSAYAKAEGKELWAVIDKKTFSIKSVGVGTAGHAEGVFQDGSGFAPGDSVWHTHPSGKMVWRGDLESIVASGGRWIFASGKNLSGIDVYTTGYTRASQVSGDYGRGNVTRHIYESGDWRTEPYNF